MEILKKEFQKAILELNRLEIIRIFEKVKESNTDINFINDVMIPVLESIGDRWEKGETALSQVYMSGRICEELIDYILKNECTLQNKYNISIAIGTFNDFHGLGKKIIYSALKTYGFKIIDYGIGLNEDILIEKIEKDKIKILLISVLMLQSALKIKNVVKKIKTRGLNIKILVGGAPFRLDGELWKQVGADAMAINPKEAADIILMWMGELECLN